jgi:hypothetical protein
MSRKLGDILRFPVVNTDLLRQEARASGTRWTEALDALCVPDGAWVLDTPILAISVAERADLIVFVEPWWPVRVTRLTSRLVRQLRAGDRRGRAVRQFLQYSKPRRRLTTPYAEGRRVVRLRGTRAVEDFLTDAALAVGRSEVRV